jgi:SAM-dependent methyltransferase
MHYERLLKRLETEAERRGSASLEDLAPALPELEARRRPSGSRRRARALKRAGHRVRVVRGYAEDFELEAPVDAAVMINVLHWCSSPQLALRNAATNVKSGGYLAIVQGVRDAKGAWVGIIPAYLLGAPRLPPTRSELYQMIKEEGLRVVKSYSLPNELILAKVP